jgi:hypothetical protein
MTILTPELRHALEQAGDQPVEINDPQTNTEYILLRADVYKRMREILEEDGDRREKEA